MPEWTRTQTIYLDTSNPTSALLRRDSETTQQNTSGLRFVAGDKFPLRLAFYDLSAGAAITLASGFTLAFAGKLSTAINGSTLLFLTTSFTGVTVGSETHYSGTLDLNTEEIMDAFDAAPTSNELSVVVDVEYRNAANTERVTLRVPCTLLRQVYTDEGTPGSATPVVRVTQPSTGDVYLLTISATGQLEYTLEP
jgi:hypothetical protein